MKFFTLESRIAPRRDRRRGFSPETLEGRNLLSTVVAGPAAHVQAATHSTPMKGSGQGIISLAEIDKGQVTYTGTGHVSHLGRVTISGGHITYPTGGSILNGDTIPVGSLTLTAANGDKLELAYTGSGSLASTPQDLGHTPPIVLFNDTFNYTITGGTGRFAGATGSGVIHALDQAPSGAQAGQGLLPYTFDLSGVLSTVGSSHKIASH